MINLVLFAGGKGTRLGSLSKEIPKPMLIVNGKPLIHRVIDLYYGLVDKIIICAGYKSKTIEDYFSNMDNVFVIDTGEETGTAKRLELVKKHITSDIFFLNYSDALSDVNIKDLVKFHKSKKSDLTILSVNPPTMFGLVESDQTGRVTKFQEKTPIQNVYINGGFFVCSKSLLEIFTEIDDHVMFEDQYIFSKLINKNIYTHKHNGFWQCVDTIKDLNILSKKVKDV